MKFSGLAVGLAMGLLGCQGSGGAPQAPSSPSGAKEPTASSTVEAEERADEAGETRAALWRRFAEAWNGSAQDRLEPFRARAGLIALDNPGAFVRLRLLESAADLQSLEGEYDLARLKRVRLKAELAPGEAPKPSCEDDLPAKGTQGAPVDRFLLGVRFRALTEYELATKSEIDRLAGPVETATAAARFAIYDLEANVGFLFGEEHDRIVLLAIDAVIPCSA